MTKPARRSQGSSNRPHREADPRTRSARAMMDGAYWVPELTELSGRIGAQGISCAEEAIERLAAYCAEIARWSAHTNLVSRSDVSQLVSKHVSASLGVLLAAEPRRGESWIDVGSGAGFPGLVIKLCRPGSDVALLDSSHKKTMFLEAVREKLSIRGLEVITARVEESRADRRASASAPWMRPFDVILMRAVASLADSFPEIDGVSGPGSRLLTYKGPAWESELEAASRKMSAGGWSFEGETRIPWTLGRILRFRRA